MQLLARTKPYLSAVFTIPSYKDLGDCYRGVITGEDGAELCDGSVDI